MRIPAIVVAMLPGCFQGATAQTPSSMWGTAPAQSGAQHGDPGTHTQNATLAGAVNAAQQRLLLGQGLSISVQAIGSQTIVSTTIAGNGNNVSVNAIQSSTNSAPVSTTGVINGIASGLSPASASSK